MFKHLKKEIPVVSQNTAINEKIVFPKLAQGSIIFPRSIRLTAACEARFSYDRFVAVTLNRKQISLMHPIFSTNCIVILDRHATVFDQSTTENESMVYAIKLRDEMLIGYVSKFDRTLVLRYTLLSHPVRLLPIRLGYSVSDLIVGRVCGSIQTS